MISLANIYQRSSGIVIRAEKGIYTGLFQGSDFGGMEFYDVNFSYVDMYDMSEHYVSVPEQGGGKLIPEGMCNPGQVYTVSHGKSDMIGVFRLESQLLPGSGKFDKTGLGSDRECKGVC